MAHKTLLIVATVALVAVAAAAVVPDYSRFAGNHMRVFADEAERLERAAIYMANHAKAEAHNALGLSWTESAEGPFGDWTEAEFVAYLTKQGTRPEVNSTAEEEEVFENTAIPAKFDWRNKGMVGPVKDQGECGSCWTFSAVGALEVSHSRNWGALQAPLAEQQVLDCCRQASASPSGGVCKESNGCKGGLMQEAFSYIQAAGGVTLGELDPYMESVKVCNETLNEPAVSVRDFHTYHEVSDKNMKGLIYNKGALSIAVNAMPFQLYHRGIFNPRVCPKKMLNHGVVASGYGPNFITLRNSWSESWGENGYIRMASADTKKAGNCAPSCCGLAQEPISVSALEL